MDNSYLIEKGFKITNYENQQDTFLSYTFKDDLKNKEAFKALDTDDIEFYGLDPDTEIPTVFIETNTTRSVHQFAILDKDGSLMNDGMITLEEFEQLVKLI